jgi:hypothetical protein
MFLDLISHLTSCRRNGTILPVDRDFGELKRSFHIYNYYYGVDDDDDDDDDIY